MLIAAKETTTWRSEREGGAYGVRRDRETQVHWLLEVFSVLELLQCSLGWGWCSTMRI